MGHACRMTIGLLLAAGLALQAAAADEPSYRGEPLSVWLERIKDPESRPRLRAVRALGVLAWQDGAAIPPLLRALRDEDDNVRAEAIRVVGWLGERAADGLPDLLSALSD